MQDSQKSEILKRKENANIGNKSDFKKVNKLKINNNVQKTINIFSKDLY